MLKSAVLLMLLLLLMSCENQSEDSENLFDTTLDLEYGKPLLDTDEQSWKDDSLNGAGGPSVHADSSDTAVWEVYNQWSDRDTPAARKAGMAWPANSSMTWDEKYAVWVQSMERQSGETSYDTFQLMTPHGKLLPAPSLECAEVGIFMRAAFASWYNLPFYMSAWTPQGSVYFGHFGVRTKNGKYKSMPKFKTKYQDYTVSHGGQAGSNWPSDSSLRKRFLTVQKDDKNTFLGANLYSGAYFDEIFLNKRTGHFLMVLLTYVGSIHLASPENTFNLVAPEIGAGDLLLLRWQKKGIGHTYVIKSVKSLPGGQLEGELVSGSMPRRQPKWENAAKSKYSFTKSTAGGPGLSQDNYAYAALGGGVKRWRTPVVKDGVYYNVVPANDQEKFISAGNHLKLSQRVQVFEEILGSLPPEAVTATLVELIDGYREHLRQYPASCSARIHREESFLELYNHLAEHGSLSRADVDRKYRVFEDYVFAELVYDESRTCCWNSTTADMYQVIMGYAQSHTYDATSGICQTPPVFKMTNGGYQSFADHAAQMGINWVSWSADESCPQSSASNDAEAEHGWTDFCEIHEDVVDFQPEIVSTESEPESDDEPEVALGTTSDGCSVSEVAGCNGCSCEACVCAADDYCCGTAWDSLCVTACTNDCGGNCQ